MVFKFRIGCHLAGDAQLVGETLTRIREERGRLTAPDVVRNAQGEASPLHRYFEWNDATAAEAHRLDQARHLLRSVVLVQTEEHGAIRPIRAFAKITTPEIDSYEPIAHVMANPALRLAVLREVRSEIKHLREKVESFEDLAELVTALDQVDKVAAVHANIE